MKATDNGTTLQQAIAELREKRTEELDAMRMHANSAITNFDPSDLIQLPVKAVLANAGLRGELIDTALGWTAGRLAERVITGNRNNRWRRLAGNLFRMLISNVAYRNAFLIRQAGESILEELSRRRRLQANRSDKMTIF